MDSASTNFDADSSNCFPFSMKQTELITLAMPELLLALVITPDEMILSTKNLWQSEVGGRNFFPPP